MNKNELGLLDIILVIAKRKYLVITICCIVAVAAIIYSLVVPEYWESKATLMPIAESGSIGSLGGSFMDILGGGLLQTDKYDMAVDFIYIMQSRKFREEVVRKFNLIQYYKIKEPDSLKAMELAVRKLSEETMEMFYDQKTYLVNIKAETKDRELSRQMVQHHLDALSKYILNSKMSKGRQKRQFLEKQVEEHKQIMDSLAMRMRDFQKKNRSIDITQQTQSLIKLYSDVVAEYMQAELEYSLALTQYDEKSPIVKSLTEKMKLLKKKVQSLEKNNSDLVPEYIVQIDKIPDISMQYAQMMLNVEIEKQIIEYLYPQYELAKLEEVKDLPTFEIYDAPQIAGIRSKPKRAITVIVSTVAAFIFSCILALILESFQGENREKILAIKAALFRKRKQS
ncbi:MAG TPA: Wzz/FepE/Etk N-terminal domain-containing protein [Candidatus Cloacimonas sp.]|jgi:tyrosine-protein kinase Etk/Wzc|nr:Wzz/FepE/Etk N-terminal domain-containing protein [Candidatus Cloacimonas sp.]HOQ78263.1 Wzz/FepE/Etk N-terminal domain-containing protein [Candidatus Cloacimonas sp.]HQJ96267.1 Wzz/FepE/Etk N-terminal domain-containing protein [Candidatus Cloacimonas sp.]HRR00896.1 Wzz/FepE/Etk N-terminal domain-containing protein [Candidatus Cloacimonas sp.]HRV10804.1 Wzz/FepE/Etk N-terminal domain-containing protein [Candidatus Cloacimonas sp.]